MSTLNLRQIQGFILRMYRMPMVRHFLLKVNTPAAARVLLGRLASGDERDAPQITTAEEWHVAVPGPEDDRKAPPRRKTDYCLNVGITWSGLVALEVKDRLPRFSHGTFNAFVEGAAKRAEALGDRGASGPENWISGFGTGNDHVMVTLYALNPEAMEKYSTRLIALFAEGEAYELLAQIDGMALTEIQDGKPVPVPKVHFGYTDGLTVTPSIRGGPERALADRQQPCEPWLFVLLDESENYHLPTSTRLLAQRKFRCVQDDEAGRRRIRNSSSRPMHIGSIRSCWQPNSAAAGGTGCPLRSRPTRMHPTGGFDPARLNDFEYVNSDGSGDPRGVRCPIGAHIRRVNPRGQPVAGQGKPGGSNNSHRLIRRGMPYGPAYDPSLPYDGIERGLLGYFINTFIENQYEFVLSEWVDDSAFVGKVRLHPKSKDPLIGSNDPATSVFDIPQGDGPPLRTTGFSSFVTTRAAAYCFLPSVAALQRIATLK